MKTITKVLGALVLIAIGALAFFWGRQSSQSDLNVELSKQIYNKGEEARFTIQNNSLSKICFSSCHKHYLQRKETEWLSYNYPDCPEEDLNFSCISPRESKEFKFVVNEGIKSKLHRLAIPINKEGTAGEEFTEDKKVYSEPFDVK